VCNTTDVNAKIDAELSDTSKFNLLQKNPIDAYQKILRAYVRDLEKTGAIDAKSARAMIVDFPAHPHSFVQIKHHKPGNPIRLITVAHNSMNSKLAGFLQPILKGISSCKYTVKNSSELMTKLESIDPPPPSNSIMCSFDIKSLFPSISQQLILSSLKRKIDELGDDADLRGLSASQLITGVNVIFQTSYILHKDNFYKQAGGIPAGSPLATFLSDITLRLPR